MSLIKCPECGKVFSDRAAHCPQCGLPTSDALQTIVAGGAPQNDAAVAQTTDTNASPAAPLQPGAPLTPANYGPAAEPKPAQPQKRSTAVLLYCLIGVVVLLMALVGMVLYKGCNGLPATEEFDSLGVEQPLPDTLSTAAPKEEEEEQSPVVKAEVVDEVETLEEVTDEEVIGEITTTSEPAPVAPSQPAEQPAQ